MNSASDTISGSDKSLGRDVICPNCGQCCELLLKARDLNQQVSRKQFDYYSCPACRLVHIFPIPEDLGAYYTTGYSRDTLPNSLGELKEQAEAMRPRLSFIQRFVSAGKLLEVGGGYGAFGYLARQNGFEVEVIEMDEFPCRYMREQAEIKAICTSSIESVESSLGAYDAIALWHSIEHLGDFQGVLRVVAQHLSPSGVLVVCTPNPASLQFRMFRRFWVNLDAPRHLSLIPLPALVERLGQEGLELAFASSSDPESLAFGKWSWEASLVNMLMSAGIMPGIVRRANKVESTKGAPKKTLDKVRVLAGKLLAVPLARALNFALAPLERSAYRGSCYTAVFRRKSRPALAVAS